MTDLLIATRNAGKLREFTAIFDGLGGSLRTLDDVGIADDVEETGSTFAENARMKAESYMRLSGLVTLADDSGLEVAALNGAPGIYSARYGGVQGQAADIEIAAREILRMRDLINEILRRHTRLTDEQIDKFTDRDFYMTAQEAAEYGVVDQVLESTEDRENK